MKKFSTLKFIMNTSFLPSICIHRSIILISIEKSVYFFPLENILFHDFQLSFPRESSFPRRIPGSDYPQRVQVDTRDRGTQTISRLCTGHRGLRKHINTLGLTNSAMSIAKKGSDEQTPRHILQTCLHLETIDLNTSKRAPSSSG